MTKLTEPFWALARQGVLAVHKCSACGHMHFPASQVCRRCLSADQVWEPVSGQGTIWSWIRMHRAYWDGFKSDIPYVVAMIELVEGPMLISNLVGNDKPFEIGDRVIAVFEPITPEIFLPKFKLLS